MRVWRPILVAAAVTLAGCASYDDYYYAGERSYYRDDAYYRDDDRYVRGGYHGDPRYRAGHGDYWYRGTPSPYAPPLYESTYYWWVLRPVYAWTWDPWYVPGWYYGITYFPSPRWTSRWYVGWSSRPYWHYYSPWRYSWADNWYDWYGWHFGYSHYGRAYGWRARERDRWRASYVDDYRHTYRDRYSAPRFGSAYNEATWLADSSAGSVIDFPRVRMGDEGASDPSVGLTDGGRVERWDRAPSSGRVGEPAAPEAGDGGLPEPSDRAERGRWVGERGADEPAPDAGPGPGPRPIGGVGRDYELLDPIEPEQRVTRWADERADDGQRRPAEPSPRDPYRTDPASPDPQPIDAADGAGLADRREATRWSEPATRPLPPEDSGYRDLRDVERLHGWRESATASGARPVNRADADGGLDEAGAWTERDEPRWETREAPRWQVRDESRWDEPPEARDERYEARGYPSRDEPRWDVRTEAREAPRWPAREEPRWDAPSESREAPRWEVREEPRWEPREAPRWEPPAREESPRYDAPDRDEGARFERFERDADESPY